MRKLCNGNYIQFNGREPIPAKIEGYSQSPDDPTLWILDYCPCVQRVLKERRLSCGKLVTLPCCKLLDLPTNPLMCKECNREGKGST